MPCSSTFERGRQRSKTGRAVGLAWNVGPLRGNEAPEVRAADPLAALDREGGLVRRIVLPRKTDRGVTAVQQVNYATGGCLKYRAARAPGLRQGDPGDSTRRSTFDP